MKFVKVVDGTPNICDLVLEQSSREREDPVDGLAYLQDVRIIPSLGVQRNWKRFQQWRERETFRRMEWEVPILIVCNPSKEWKVEESEGRNSGDANLNEPRDTYSWKHAYPQQICKNSWRIEQRHLFKAQCAYEKDTAPQVTSSKHARHARHSETQHDGVVLKMSVVNQQGSRLHQNCNESNRPFPDVDLLISRVSSEEDDQGRNVNEVFGRENGSTHIYLQQRIVQRSRVEDCEPFGIDSGTTC